MVTNYPAEQARSWRRDNIASRQSKRIDGLSRAHPTYTKPGWHKPGGYGLKNTPRFQHDIYEYLDRKHPYHEGFKKVMKTNQFDSGWNESYNSPYGYAINKIGKRKVMYVSGSRDARDWAGNLELPMDVLANFAPFLRPLASGGTWVNRVYAPRTIKRLDKIARDQKVDVVLGHSRHGGLVSRLPTRMRHYRTGGLDAAMVLNNPFNKYQNSMPNYHQSRGPGLKGFTGALLDPVLAIGGRNNQPIPAKGYTWTLPHYTWRDRANYKDTYSKYYTPETNFFKPAAGMFGKESYNKWLYRYPGSSAKQPYSYF